MSVEWFTGVFCITSAVIVIGLLINIYDRTEENHKDIKAIKAKLGLPRNEP